MVCIATGSGFLMMIGLLMLLLRHQIGSWFVDDPRVIQVSLAQRESSQRRLRRPHTQCCQWAAWCTPVTALHRWLAAAFERPEHHGCQWPRFGTASEIALVYLV